jgi:3-(3-hydroxy-phenyl)propionate hydroxylase
VAITPPFIGQGLGGGLRDADNVAWKTAQVLAGQAGRTCSPGCGSAG